MSLDLFGLLPAVYRTRDYQVASTLQLLNDAEKAELGALMALTTALSADQQARLSTLQTKASTGPLQALMLLIQQQMNVLDDDLDQLLDNQFIETCAPWVIPYIGDLIGYSAVKGIAPAVDDPRAAVADTISLRQRKGTVLVLEQLARDVTGWGAHAVEEFQVLATTQNVKHVRRHNFFAPDVRDWKTRVYADTAFERLAHRIDVRDIAQRRGRYNIANIGIYLWSLSAQSMTLAPLTPAGMGAGGALCFRFHPLGMDVPLFHRARTQGDPISSAAQPANVPEALPRRVLCADLAQGAGSQFYGEGASLALYLNGNLLDPYQIAVANLSGAEGAWLNAGLVNAGYRAAVDPELGRVVLASSTKGQAPTASWFYGQNADRGGGEYARNTDAQPFAVTDAAYVVPFPSAGFSGLQDAINAALRLLPEKGAAAVEIAGGLVNGAFPSVSDVHAVTGALAIDVPGGATLELRAAEDSVQTVTLAAALTLSGGAASSIVFNGLVFAAQESFAPATSEAGMLIAPATRPSGELNTLASLQLVDCTLVPGWNVHVDGTPFHAGAASLNVVAPGIAVQMQSCITGGLRTQPLATVALSDTVVDATDRTAVAYASADEGKGGAALTLNGCTVVGKVRASVLTMVTNSIVWASKTAGWVAGLIAERKQQGCVRFSFVPIDAVTPPPYMCVKQAIAAPGPYFVATRYGQPGYMKLMACTDGSIRTGADDGGEMGAYHSVLAPLRERDLDIRLQEYMPVGLESGVIYEN